MGQTFDRLFSQLPKVSPSNDLAIRVLARIRVAQRRRAVLHITGAVSIAIASVAAVIPAVLSGYSAISSSGFLQYLSLVFTDGSALVGVWQEFGLQLIESFPVVAGISVIGSIGAVVTVNVFAVRVCKIERAQLLASYHS